MGIRDDLADYNRGVITFIDDCVIEVDHHYTYKREPKSKEYAVGQEVIYWTDDKDHIYKLH